MNVCRSAWGCYERGHGVGRLGQATRQGPFPGQADDQPDWPICPSLDMDHDGPLTRSPIHRWVAPWQASVKCDPAGSSHHATHRPRRKGEIGRQAKTLGRSSLSRCTWRRQGGRIECRGGQGVTVTTTTIDVHHASAPKPRMCIRRTIFYRLM